MQNLNTLNSLRVAAGLKPLKAWKESKAKLAAAIAKFAPAKLAKSSTFSAADVIAEFNMNPKVGRALLRKHNVERTEAAVRAFFKARAK